MASTSLPRARHRTPILLAALALLAACGDDPVGPVRPPAQPNVQQLDVSVAERAALRELTRAVAMAMENEGVRQQVKNDMRASRVTHEHKLHFSSYLKGQSGGLLLAQMSRATGLSRDTLQALVAAVRPLEFYLPVKGHRERWRGSADVLVASTFDDEDRPVGFDVRGTEVPLDVAAPPTAPVVALVPMEADFAAPLDEASLKGLRVTNTNDQSGQAVGTYTLEGMTATSSSSYNASAEDGIYMTYNELNETGESWAKGDPELEVHLHGPRNKDYPQHGEDLSCSGQHAQDYRKYYNQDGRHFIGLVGSGAPLLADRYDMNQAQAKFPDGGRYFIMWEDDDTACVVKTDNDMLQIFTDAAKAAGSAGAAVRAKGGGLKGAVITTAVTFVVKLFTNAGFLKTNDDLIGVMVPKENAPNFAGYPGTHIILKGGSYNGNADLAANWPDATNGRPYMANLVTDVQTLEMNLASSQRQLSAVVYDQYGAVRSGHPVAWRSNSSWVANVTESGMLYVPNPGTATVYARACDPECIDQPIAVSVTGPTVSGPNYLAEGQMGTIYGGVVNPRQGSYWYQWTVSYCTNGSSCPSGWYEEGSGWNGPGQINLWMGAYDAFAEVSLSIYTAPGGELVGTRSMQVQGPNQWPGCEGTSEIDCQPYLTAGATAGTARPATGARRPVAQERTESPAKRRVRTR